MTAEYEALAEAFYRETRILAPGKDRPSELGGYSEWQLHAALWDTWRRKQQLEERLLAISPLLLAGMELEEAFTVSQSVVSRIHAIGTLRATVRRVVVALAKLPRV